MKQYNIWNIYLGILKYINQYTCIIHDAYISIDRFNTILSYRVYCQLLY